MCGAQSYCLLATPRKHALTLTVYAKLPYLVNGSLWFPAMDWCAIQGVFIQAPLVFLGSTRIKCVTEQLVSRYGGFVQILVLSTSFLLVKQVGHEVCSFQYACSLIYHTIDSLLGLLLLRMPAFAGKPL